MIYLHRSFFSQAMLDFPTNPLRSPYAPSFLTAYRCSSVIIKATAHQFDRCAELAMRVWFLLYHTFSAAMIVGSVVTRSPNSTMAASALSELGIAISLFQKTAIHSRRARVALNVLTKLQEKATRVYTQFRTGTTPLPNRLSASLLSGLQAEECENQLAIFGGQTKLLGRKHKTSHSTSDRNSPHRRSSSSPSSSGASPPASPESVHPSLMEYLSSSFSPGYPANQGAPPPIEGADMLLDSPIPNLIPNYPRTAPLIPPTNWDPLPHEENSPFTWFDQQRNPANTSGMMSSFGIVKGDMLPVDQTSVPTPIPAFQFLAAQPETTATQDILDLGLTSESGLDEQWMIFMRECGILDSNFRSNHV
jgi:hypothetical protein